MSTTGTIFYSPWFEALDTDGVTIAGALLYFYAAGTTTPVDTFADVALTVPNSNPVVCDGAGRAVIYLTPGVSYKVLFKTPAGTTIATADNIAAVPSSTVDLDVTAVAGEDLTAGQPVYLSSGAGSTTAGRWYRANGSTASTSTLPGVVGIPSNDIASGVTGTVRIDGRVTNLSGLSSGIPYYVGASAGTLDDDPPANARTVGVADSSTSLILTGTPYVPLEVVQRCDGVLTLTTGAPFPATDVSSAATAYFTPHTGNRIALYDASGQFRLYTFAEITISLAGLTASTPYDVFAYSNDGTVTIDTLAWTDSDTRATDLTRQHGVLVQSGSVTRRYLGSIYINATGGQSDDSATKRYVYNAAHQQARALRVTDSTDTWTYSTAAYRQANGSTANQVEIMVGQEGVALELSVLGLMSSSNNGSEVAVGMGEDSTTVEATGFLGAARLTTGSTPIALTKHLRKSPTVGYHYYAWLEYGAGGGTQTWVGDGGSTRSALGLTGWVR